MHRRMEFRQTCRRSFYGGCARETFESAGYPSSVCEPARSCHPQGLFGSVSPLANQAARSYCQPYDFFPDCLDHPNHDPPRRVVRGAVSP